MLRMKVVAAIIASVVSVTACSKDPEVAKREHVKSGDKYVAQQKYREAIIEYRNAVQADPRFGEARLKLADAYIRVNEPQNAFPELVRAADLMPENLEAQLKTGHLLLLAEQFEDASSRADKALAAHPDNIEAQILKGSALAGMRDLDAAASQLETAIGDDPSRGATYSNLGFVQQQKGDLAGAEQSLRRATELDTQSVEAHLALATFYWSTDRREAAEKAVAAALTQDPRNVVANRTLAGMYMASGRIAEAEQPLRVVADAAPGSTGQLALADYYIAARRPTDAQALLERVASEADGFAPARLKLAGLSAATGDRANAYRLIEEILTKDAKHVEALSSKAELQVADGKLEEALTTIRSAQALAPNAANVHFLHGRILAARSDVDGAAAAYHEALRLNPRFGFAHIELARVNFLLGKPDDVIHFAQSALQLLPTSADARLLLARGQIAKGDASAAERTLAPLNKAYPDLAAVQTEMGRLFALKKDRVKARAAYERAIAKEPTRVAALEGLAALDLQEKNATAARARIEAAVTAAPQNVGLHLLAARLHVALKDSAAAERALKQALAINPNTLEVYALLGQLYANDNRLSEATAEFETLAQKQPKAVGPQVALGVLLQMQNRTSEARVHYEKALALDSRAAVAANNLAWLYAEEGDQLDVALQLAQSAKALLPDVPQVSDTLGWVYYKKGMATLAITPLREAVAKDPKSAAYLFHLGMAYAEIGDVVNARQSLLGALALDPNMEGANDARAAVAALGTR